MQRVARFSVCRKRSPATGKESRGRGQGMGLLKGWFSKTAGQRRMGESPVQRLCRRRGGCKACAPPSCRKWQTWARIPGLSSPRHKEAHIATQETRFCKAREKTQAPHALPLRAGPVPRAKPAGSGNLPLLPSSTAKPLLQPLDRLLGAPQRMLLDRFRRRRRPPKKSGRSRRARLLFAHHGSSRGVGRGKGQATPERGPSRRDSMRGLGREGKPFCTPSILRPFVLNGTGPGGTVWVGPVA